MDTPADFRAWVSEQVGRAAPPHDPLIRRVERAFGRARTSRSLMQGPVVPRALRRLILGQLRESRGASQGRAVRSVVPNGSGSRSAASNVYVTADCPPPSRAGSAGAPGLALTGSTYDRIPPVRHRFNAHSAASPMFPGPAESRAGGGRRRTAPPRAAGVPPGAAELTQSGWTLHTPVIRAPSRPVGPGFPDQELLDRAEQIKSPYRDRRRSPG